MYAVIELYFEQIPTFMVFEPDNPDGYPRLITDSIKEARLLKQECQDGVILSLTTRRIVK